MDNWITLLLGTIGLGILSNLAWELGKVVYNRSIFSSKKIRIKSLLEEYRSIEEMRADSSKMVIFYLKQIFLFAKMILSTVIICLLVIIIGFPRIEAYPIVYFITALYVIIIFLYSRKISSEFNSLKYINSPIKYIEYRLRTNLKLQSLGSNTGELEKIDNEVKFPDEKEVKEWKQIKAVLDLVDTLSDEEEKEVIETLKPITTEKKTGKVKTGG